MIIKQIIYIVALVFLPVMVISGCDADDTISPAGDSDPDSDFTETEIEPDIYEQGDKDIEETGERELVLPDDPGDWVGFPCDRKEAICSLDRKFSIFCNMEKGQYDSWNCKYDVLVDGHCIDYYAICRQETGYCGYNPLPAGSFCRNFETGYDGVCDENGDCLPCGGDTDIECPEDNLL